MGRQFSRCTFVPGPELDPEIGKPEWVATAIVSNRRAFPIPLPRCSEWTLRNPTYPTWGLDRWDVRARWPAILPSDSATRMAG
jgi:hypothetical protein